MQTSIGDVPIINQFWYVQYIYSLYWASTTMLGVGYGDIYPRNVNEVTFTIIAEYISCAIFAYSINEVWQIFKDMK
jgi:potassium voltage-gated channel Eag-related subfamily H protein 1/potassium voltage-gated channel Eag-related subfamily H protein 5